MTLFSVPEAHYTNYFPSALIFGATRSGAQTCRAFSPVDGSEEVGWDFWWPFDGSHQTHKNLRMRCVFVCSSEPEWVMPLLELRAAVKRLTISSQQKLLEEADSSPHHSRDHNYKISVTSPHCTCLRFGSRTE